MNEVFYVLVLVGSVLTLVSGTCAPPEAVYPCTCNMDNLECGNLSLEQLRAVFAAQKDHPGGTTLNTVLLSDYRLRYIPHGLLSGITFRSLVVNPVFLESFHDPTTNLSSFAGVERTLTSITINFQSRPVFNFDWNSLLPLKNLRNILLSGTLVSFNVPFPPLPTVAIFWLHHSDVLRIAKNAFAGLTGVQELRVVNNKVETYRRNMFPRPASNLSIFITEDDDITTLPEDYFDEMPALTYVDIPRFVHNIPPLNVKGPTNLQSSRGLTCDTRLRWLLRMRDEGKVNILHAICARPQHLFWRDVSSLTDKDL